MIDDVKSLRTRYAEPNARSLAKQLDRLDAHCTRFVALSPFFVIASGSSDHRFDASPRGGAPGFVKVLDEKTLLIPDAPGNNRLDTLTNITSTGRVGLLFFIPGVDETLRVNGQARLTDDAAMIRHFSGEARVPRLVVVVTVEDAYLHCAKALMRSKLWDSERHVERSVLPTMGQMINDQTGGRAAPETQEQMLARYAQDL